MKSNKKFKITAFLMIFALGSQNQYASSPTYDEHGIGTDSRGNRFYFNQDGSNVIKMSENTITPDLLRKTDASGHALDYNAFKGDESHAGWKKLKVVDKQRNALDRYEVDPQGTVFKAIFDSRTGMSRPLKIEDPVQQHLLNELAAKLDAIEVPARL